MYWLLTFSSVLSYAVGLKNGHISPEVAFIPFSFSAVTNAHGGERIVGGELTTIDRYPFQAALLHGTYNIFYQSCGGSILNSRSILSAAHCFWFNLNPQNHRIRVGSSFANSGGVVHSASQIINHPNYNVDSPFDSDVAVVRSSTVINYNSFVQPVAVAGTNYNLLDNQAVWATGWGLTSHGGSPSEQLRHVQIWTINQDICRSRYGAILTDNMLCAGVLDVGGKAQCSQDSGGPLLHNGVVVGITSFSSTCGDPYFPAVNARVSRFTTWIQANA